MDDAEITHKPKMHEISHRVLIILKRFHCVTDVVIYVLQNMVVTSPHLLSDKHNHVSVTKHTTGFVHKH